MQKNDRKMFETCTQRKKLPLVWSPRKINYVYGGRQIPFALKNILGWSINSIGIYFLCKILMATPLLGLLTDYTLDFGGKPGPNPKMVVMVLIRTGKNASSESMSFKFSTSTVNMKGRPVQKSSISIFETLVTSMENSGVK